MSMRWISDVPSKMMKIFAGEMLSMLIRRLNGHGTDHLERDRDHTEGYEGLPAGNRRGTGPVPETGINAAHTGEIGALAATVAHVVRPGLPDRVRSPNDARS